MLVGRREKKGGGKEERGRSATLGDARRRAGRVQRARVRARARESRRERIG